MAVKTVWKTLFNRIRNYKICVADHDGMACNFITYFTKMNENQGIILMLYNVLHWLETSQLSLVEVLAKNRLSRFFNRWLWTNFIDFLNGDWRKWNNNQWQCSGKIDKHRHHNAQRALWTTLHDKIVFSEGKSMDITEPADICKR